LQRTVKPQRGRAASASFHCALAARSKGQRAAAELRRYAARPAGAQIVTLSLVLAGVVLCLGARDIGAQELPPNVSREPNCLPDTLCLKEGDIYIPSTVPDGFSRAPNCADGTICVSESLYMVHADFLAIREFAERQFPADNWEVTDIAAVMDDIVVVTIQTKERGWSWGAGARFLIEKRDGGWAVIRRSRWVV
jgi:hypothetical protein